MPQRPPQFRHGQRAKEYWYYYHDQQQTLDAIAEQFGVKPTTVRDTLQRNGYAVARAQSPVLAPETSVQFVLSQRLWDAIQALGHQTLQYGLLLLSQATERLIFEPLGQGETRQIRKFPQLTAGDLGLIDSLAARIDYGDRSMVVRLAIEALIETQNLPAFAKPAHWQPRRAALVQGGANPVPSLDAPTKPKSITVPDPLFAQLAPYKKQRGQAHTPAISLSEFAREAIASIAGEPLQPLSPEELVPPMHPITLLLYEHQHQILQSLAEDPRMAFASSGEVLRAILKHALTQTNSVTPSL